MSDIGVVEDTLFVPMLGRIYASESYPMVLYDEKALSLKEMLPNGLVERDNQSQYTLIASAARSANVDCFIKDFLRRKPDGIIVQLGCGLETTFYRNDNGKTCWYAVDLPAVIAYRKMLIPEVEREKYLSGDAFYEAWIKHVRNEAPKAPILVTASGLFYYFEEDKICGLFRMLQGYGDIEVVFDAVSKSGMYMMRKKYMKEVGHEDAKMFFYVDEARQLETAVGGDIKVLEEEKYYKYISRRGLKLSTKISMNVSDLLSMVKMIHIVLS